MNQSYLITGTPSSLMTSLVTKLLDQGNRVTILLDEGAEGFHAPEGLDTGLTLIQNNPRSPLPAKTYFLSLESEEQKLDHAIHFYYPGTKGRTLTELDSGTIDRLIDSGIKGFLFPLRETLTVLQGQKSGSLTLVCVGGVDQVLPPLEAGVFGAVQEIGRSLFTLYQNERISLRGIHGASDLGDAQIEEYILQAITEDSPKTRYRWNRYTGKTGIFGLRK